MAVEKTARQIYTISKLTQEIKSLLEETYPFIWVIGEISNYSVPGSGHSYFSLKDQNAVINCVIFKNQKRNLKFKPTNGLKIIGLARLAVYEPRGSYQLIFEHIEPEGTGSIQLAFEQLKNKLSEKGYFDDKYKKPIPVLPSRISIITSATGAAVKDIINIAQRRLLSCPLEIIPVKVQGEGSEREISDAIFFVNQFKRSDLIILARGGGSIEDLWAFNSEIVANAIFHSYIPIISGIGHETDYTIADFVADLRAPTPSAAAELALLDQKSVTLKILQLQESLNTAFEMKVKQLQQNIHHLVSRLKNPASIIDDFRFRLEDYELRLNTNMNQYVQTNKEKCNWLTASLSSKQPQKRIIEHRQQVKRFIDILSYHFRTNIQAANLQYLKLVSKLEALDPMAVLKRGYSISRFAGNQKIITDTNNIKKNDQIEVILSKGSLITKVEKING